MKTEVRALEYAVCALVHKLDILLTTEIGLRLFDVGNGLHISTPDHLSVGTDAFVTIEPTDWPKGSYIHARFFYGACGWELLEGGTVEANHLQIPADWLRFTPTNEGLGIRLHAFGEYQRGYIARAYDDLIASLQKDAAAHQVKDIVS